jgi:hypothetical protein
MLTDIMRRTTDIMRRTTEQMAGRPKIKSNKIK